MLVGPWSDPRLDPRCTALTWRGPTGLPGSGPLRDRGSGIRSLHGLQVGAPSDSRAHGVHPPRQGNEAVRPRH